jgi:hypothetical protein
MARAPVSKTATDRAVLLLPVSKINDLAALAANGVRSCAASSGIVR